MARTVDELLSEVPRYLAERLRDREIGRQKLRSKMEGWNTGEALRVEKAVRSGEADLSVCLDEDPPEEEPEVDPNQYISDERYFYNDNTGRHVFLLRAAPKPVVLPDETLKGMKRAYSNWDGTAATINQLCRNYEIPRQWFIEVKSILGWTHDSEPFTDQEMMDTDEEDLVEEALQMRKMSVYRKFEQKKYRDTEKAAEKWREFERYVWQPLQEMIEDYAPDYEPPSISVSAGDTSPHGLIINPTDLHYGKGSWRDEVGHPYSRDEAERLLHETTEVLIEKAVPYNIERIIMPIGSDWLHIDNDSGSTTSGTAQDMDGTPAQILIEGCFLAVQYIDMLRGLAPVDVHLVQGNHDRHTSITAALMARGWFRNQEDVTVNIDVRDRTYTTYEDTLIGLTHGDMPKKELRKLPQKMAGEQREKWGRTRHSIICHGHTHMEEWKDNDGTIIYQFPSLSCADRWHDRKGYSMSRRALSGVVLHPDHGVVSNVVAPVSQVNV